MHRSVGAIIYSEDKSKILMMERKKFPPGWACPAGHVEDNEAPEDALKREIKEEANIEIKKFKLLYHEFIDWSKCSREVTGHDWFLYEVLDWEGKVIKEDREAKEMKWIAINEIKEVRPEEVWEYWFKKLSII